MCEKTLFYKYVLTYISHTLKRLTAWTVKTQLCCRKVTAAELFFIAWILLIETFACKNIQKHYKRKCIAELIQYAVYRQLQWTWLVNYGRTKYPQMCPSGFFGHWANSQYIYIIIFDKQNSLAQMIKDKSEWMHYTEDCLLSMGRSQLHTHISSSEVPPLWPFPLGFEEERGCDYVIEILPI